MFNWVEMFGNGDVEAVHVQKDKVVVDESTRIRVLEGVKNTNLQETMNVIFPDGVMSVVKQGLQYIRYPDSKKVQGFTVRKVLG